MGCVIRLRDCITVFVYVDRVIAGVLCVFWILSVKNEIARRILRQKLCATNDVFDRIKSALHVRQPESPNVRRIIIENHRCLKVENDFTRHTIVMRFLKTNANDKFTEI